MEINNQSGVALNTQGLNSLAKSKQENTQTLSTGRDAKSSPAEYAIATKMDGEARAFEAAKISQGVTEAAVGVGRVAGQAISGLLSDARAKAILAQAGGLSDADRSALQTDIDKNMQQIDSLAKNAEFNGVNFLDSESGQGGSVFSTISGPDGDKISFQAPAFDRKSLGLDGIDVKNGEAAAKALEQASQSVQKGLAELGSTAAQLAQNSNRLGQQAGALAAGSGLIVNADMGRVAATESSLRVRSQLQAQSASIANNQPAVLNQLFR